MPDNAARLYVRDRRVSLHSRPEVCECVRGLCECCVREPPNGCLRIRLVRRERYEMAGVVIAASQPIGVLRSAVEGEMSGRRAPS